MADPSRVLTDKQDRFVDLIAKGIFPDEAAEKAGYRNDDGSWTVKAASLLRKKRVKEALANRAKAQTIYGKTKMNTGIKASVELLLEVVDNENVDLKLRKKAADEILDRGGLTDKNYRSVKYNISTKQNFSRDDKKELRETIIDLQRGEDGSYEPE